jgi:beta-glucosidase
MSKNNKQKKPKVVLWSVLSIIMVIVLCAAAYGTNLAMGSAQAINIALKTSTYKIEGGSGETVSYETGFDSTEELEAHDKEVAEQLMGEGAVLIKNDNDALPLAAGSAVSTFSHSSVDIVTCGTGSADIDTSAAPTLKEALEDVGLSVNPTLWDFYDTGAGSGEDYTRAPGKGVSLGNRSSWALNEVPVSVFTSDVTSSLTQYKDAAIVTISRIAGEGSDLETGDYVDGTNILSLNDTERELLKYANETCDKVIVLINSTNALECDFLEDEEYGVDAALWIGYTGTWGLNAVADILVGNVNPSGKLVDTFCYDNTTAPSVVSLYGGTYTNYDENDTDKWYSVYNGQLDGNSKYITYMEDIYIGYRYYETRYEDVVMGTANVGDYDYDATVAYPFGSGLSYTTFAWSDFSASYDESSDSFTVSVTVTNTGDVAGKDVVEIYFQSPYTDYDKANGIEKASVELCGFDKTEILEPGKSETVTVTVPREELATYDSEGAGTYILEDGDYYLTAGHDAHDAVNNILAAKGYSSTSTTASADMTYQYTNDKMDTETYSVSSATGAEITNQFDSADLSQYGYDVTYLSRSNWTGTWPQVMELEATDEMFTDGLKIYQTYETDADSTTEMPTTGADNGMTLAMMIGLDYDDPAWDDLLDQVTFEEMATLIGQGYHNTALVESVAKPATTDDNGPQGFTQTLTGVETSHCAYTDENIMAATWNVELMEEVGECLGTDVLDLGATGLYGPAMDTHRNAYCGRNFEYYSEDGFLAGKIAAAEIKGIQSKGIYVYIKHFALNDTETGCRCISTWANEQSIREIYLKPFEIAVVEGGAKNVMNSFARVGVVWSGAHEGLMTNVLRGEWGMTGFALTDFSGNSMLPDTMALQSFDAAYGVLNGTDCWDSSKDTWTNELLNMYADDPDIVAAARESTHRILYTVANSAAMNGLSSDTKIVQVTPWWQIAIYAVDVVLVILLILCIVQLIINIKRKKEQA